ncbi:membrane protein [Bacteroidia bacterium]|nr:membrane protein [Bacteroidia bacterium]
MNYVELIGITLSLLYMWLELQQKMAMWAVGIVSALLYVVVFFAAKLYANMGLQLYYAAASVYGLYVWYRGAKKEAQPLPVTLAKRLQVVVAAGAIAILWAVLYRILSHYTDSPAPLVDAFVTAVCVVAMYGLAHKILHHWILWIIADGVSVGLCIWQQLYITSLLYFIYTVVAVVGYFKWKKAMNAA